MKWLLAMPALAALTACGTTTKSVAESTAVADSTQYVHVACERLEAAAWLTDSAAWEADSVVVLEERRPDGTVTTRLRAQRLRKVEARNLVKIARDEKVDSVRVLRTVKARMARAESVRTLKPWSGWYAVAAVGLLGVGLVIIIIRILRF